MKNDNENKIDQEDFEGQDGESGTTGSVGTAGGAGSGVYFRYKDPMSIAPRDDALPPSEIKRLLALHADLHKETVNKQKLTRKDRKALKEGLVKRIRGYMGSGFSRAASVFSSKKQHPITQKAQFSGMDRQVVSLPTENSAELDKVNEDKRNELANRLEHRLQNRKEFQHQYVPKFNPTPRPR